MKRKSKRNSLSFQAFVFITLLLVLPLFGAGYFFNTKLTEGLQIMDKERLLISSHATHALLDKMGENLVSSTKTNALWEDYLIAVKNKDLVWIEENINVAVEAIPNLHFVATSDLQGNIISQVGDVQEFSGKMTHQDLVSQIQESSEFHGLIKTSQGLAMIAGSGISNDDGTAAPEGLLVFGTILDETILADIKKTLESEVSVFTLDGSLLTTSQETTAQDLQPFMEEISANSAAEIFEINESRSVHRAHVVSSIQDVFGKPLGILYVSQQLPASSILKQEVREVSLFVFFIIIFITGLVYILLQRRILLPIQHLASILGEISKGNLKSFIEEKYLKRKDEFGDLARSTRKMRSDLHDLIEQILLSSKNVASSAHELSCSTTETMKVTHQITSAMQELASGAETQLQGADESSRAMNEMSKGIHFIAESANTVSGRSVQTEKEATLGNESIQKVVHQMENIGLSVNRSASMVQSLNERSKEIDQIIGLIQSIAEQTNLLALNASIEAARAGEHGRGFAVVANEVRKLAEQAKTSTQRVANLTIAIQTDALSSATAMIEVDQEVQVGIAAVHNAGEVFKRILQDTKEVSKQIQDVSALSQQLSANTEELGASVENMAGIAQKSTIEAQNVAVSSREQLASIQTMAVSTELLNQISKELQALILRFKV